MSEFYNNFIYISAYFFVVPFFCNNNITNFCIQPSGLLYKKSAFYYEHFHINYCIFYYSCFPFKIHLNGDEMSPSTQIPRTMQIIS